VVICDGRRVKVGMVWVNISAVIVIVQGSGIILCWALLAFSPSNFGKYLTPDAARRMVVCTPITYSQTSTWYRRRQMWKYLEYVISYVGRRYS
jgi:hypothetical protein